MVKTLINYFHYISIKINTNKLYLSRLFLITLGLFYIPSIYILPPIQNAFLTTQSIGRILIFIIFILSLLVRTKKAFFGATNIFVLLLLLTQSASILAAQSTIEFIQRYKDVFLATLIYFTAQRLKFDKKIFISILSISLVVNVLFHVLVYFKQFTSDLLSQIIYSRYYDLVIADFIRGRLYSTAYLEAYIPFYVLAYQYTGNTISKLFISIAIIVSAISNFRTRIIMAIFSITSTSLLKRNFLKPTFGIIIFSLVIGIISFTITNKAYVFERFNILESGENIETISSRVTQVMIAIEFGKNPLGIGLGNYYDNIPTAKKHSLNLSKNDRTEQFEVNSGIHNNFATVLAESGFLSLVFFLGITIVSMIKDSQFLIKMSPFSTRHATIVSFWSLFIYGLFNPPVPASYQFQFWFLRGLLEYENID